MSVATAKELETIKVLIVDDDESILQFLKILLRTKDVTIHNSSNGIEAAIKNSDPHVIFLDYILGDVTALDIITKIKPYFQRSIPIIFSGMRLADPIKTQLYNNGIMNIIQKPCSICTLEAIIENYYEVSLKYRR